MPTDINPEADWSGVTHSPLVAGYGAGERSWRDIVREVLDKHAQAIHDLEQRTAELEDRKDDR